jgi:hypothetical protein
VKQVKGFYALSRAVFDDLTLQVQANYLMKNKPIGVVGLERLWNDPGFDLLDYRFGRELGLDKLSICLTCHQYSKGTTLF